MSRSVLLCLLLLPMALMIADDEVFSAQTFTKGGATLPYRLLAPEPAERGKRYPLVVFLHGAGERGTDNRAQLTHGVRVFAKPEMRAKFPCWVIAPQCPGEYRWCEVDWTDPEPHQTPKEPSVPMGLLLGLLDEVRQGPTVDPTRIYVAGISMGGFGTWDLLTRRPTQFAAAIPVCGGADSAAAASLAKLPLRVFHGSEDGVVRTVRSQLMVAALEKAGSTVVTYTEYPGVGHDSWNQAFAEPELLPWLFAQQRPR